MQMQFPNPPQSIAILHIPGRCSLSQFPEDCGRVTQCQSIPTNPLTIQTVAPRFQSVCNPGSWPVQILRQFPSSQHNQWPFHRFQRQSRDPPLILAHSTRIASGSQVCTGLQVDWKHCIKLCGLQAHSWIQLQSATISPNVLPVLWIVPFFCNPDTMQLDFESIPKSDAIFHNPEDCKRVARFLNIPMNPWTIHQSLCNPFRFVSSISNRSIPGQLIKTAWHQPKTTAQFTHNHVMPMLATIDTINMNCITIAILDRIASWLEALHSNRIVSSFRANSWIRLQSMPVKQIPGPFTSDPVILLQSVLIAKGF